MPPPANSNQDKNEYFEEKWDKIVSKMLRAQVRDDPTFGAQLAKGLHFYYLAAMKFANELEHDFRQHQNIIIQDIGEAGIRNETDNLSLSANQFSTTTEPYRPIGIKSFTTIKRDSGNLDDTSNVHVPSINKSTVPQPVSVVREKLMVIDENVAPAAVAAPTTTTSSSSKRFSLQLEPSKISKTFKTSSTVTTPTEIQISDATTGIHVRNETNKIERIVRTTRTDSSGSSSQPTPSVENFQKSTKSALAPKHEPMPKPTPPPPTSPPEIRKPPPPISVPPAVQPPQPIPLPLPQQPQPPRIHPRGATAICNDGTYSYSQNRRGTCSWHGGVREWL